MGRLGSVWSESSCVRPRRPFYPAKAISYRGRSRRPAALILAMTGEYRNGSPPAKVGLFDEGRRPETYCPALRDNAFRRLRATSRAIAGLSRTA